MIATASLTEQTRYARTLPCLAQSVGEAREAVRAALSAWGLSELADVGTLLVTELVANSVQHTPCRFIRVIVSRRDEILVRISVVDRSHDLPVPRAADVNDAAGRGLALIETLTHRWGTETKNWGKAVWGELRSEVGQ
ncbi:ATP-binding protein [Streptomyces sp. SBT349]|uniref:ATP-binding protein n=1 Tax=Streptomyces sp. SBT349 TaxID=1580539 RepID=UPI00066DE69E|nr:ATP-binding protein [Streptomyces sp. SBT349]